MKLVIDAGVALKWLLDEAAGENDADKARALLVRIVSAGCELIQPPHWIAEIVGVTSRRNPEFVPLALEAMHAVDYVTADDDAVYLRAAELTARLKQHTFDTLCHAVALQREAILVTADQRYFDAAVSEGRIEMLANFRLA